MSHYLVAMDFRTRKLTINGEKFFETLPVLVEVRTDRHTHTQQMYVSVMLYKRSQIVRLLKTFL